MDKVYRSGDLLKHIVHKSDPMAASRHPYYPESLKLPGYVPLTIPFQQILACFFGAAFTILALTWLLSGRCKHLSSWGRLTLCWLVVTGTVHFVVEGTFVLCPDFYKNTSKNVLLEIWKEYTKADSRYATRDEFVVSMEAITAFFVGPLAYLTAIAMAVRSPWRYALQLIVSVSQIYGDVCYFGTAYLDGYRCSRPEFLYFWFYFVIVNALWIVVPGAVALNACRSIAAAVSETDRYSKVQGLSSKKTT